MRRNAIKLTLPAYLPLLCAMLAVCVTEPAGKAAGQIHAASVNAPSAPVAAQSQGVVGPVAAPTMAPAAMPDRELLRPLRLPRAHMVTMEVTAYCPCKKCCGPRARGVTASGKRVSHNDGRFVAADTSLLPFNTKLIVPGYAANKPVQVIDRGGAIKGRKLDVFFDSHREAMEWGRRKMEVLVFE